MNTQAKRTTESTFEVAQRIFADAENYSKAEILTYAELVEAIFHASLDAIEANDIIISRLSSAIDNSLTLTEASVLVLRYGLDACGHKSYKDVGQLLGYSRDRVRVIEAKALRKMRLPRRSATYSVSIRNSQLEAEQRRNETRVLLSSQDPEKELKISVKSYNCLRRAGITTVEALLNTSDDDLFQVRGIGRKSYHELIDCKKAFNN